MNLPHQAPLIFAQKVMQIEDNTATVLCQFDNAPTLPMFIEAAAQGSSAFAKSTDKSTIGFITKVNKVQLINNIQNNNYLIKITLEITVSNIRKFHFEAYDKQNNIKTASGNITILIQS